MAGPGPVPDDGLRARPARDQFRIPHSAFRTCLSLVFSHDLRNLLWRHALEEIVVHEHRSRESTGPQALDRKSTRLNSSHTVISYAVFCLKKKTQTDTSN